MRKLPEGIAVIDLKDAYPTVMEDLQVSFCLVIFISSEGSCHVFIAPCIYECSLKLKGSNPMCLLMTFVMYDWLLSISIVPMLLVL